MPRTTGYTSKNPAGENLRKMNLDCPKLDNKQARLFHTLTTARKPFSSKTFRGDIVPTTTFCTAQVGDPDKDYWEKMDRCLQYLKDTPN